MTLDTNLIASLDRSFDLACRKFPWLAEPVEVEAAVEAGSKNLTKPDIEPGSEMSTKVNIGPVQLAFEWGEPEPAQRGHRKGTGFRSKADRINRNQNDVNPALAIAGGAI